MENKSNNQSELVRDLLASELLSRCEKNPKYSLRSYARYLGLEASELSKIMRGKRQVSHRMYLKLSSKLPITSPQQKQCYHTLEQDIFHAIADWYHFAILALIKTTNFKPPRHSQGYAVFLFAIKL